MEQRKDGEVLVKVDHIEQSLNEVHKELTDAFAALKKDFTKEVDTLCTSFLEKAKEIVSEEFVRLRKEKEHIDKFKASILDFTGHKGSERIKLNVGGHAFMTTVATVTKEQSMLAAMFSPQFDTKPDDNGEYFIDRNPKHFGLILDYLRTAQVVTTGLTPRDLAEIKLELEFYQLKGMEDILFPEVEEPISTWTWNPGRMDARVQLLDNRTAQAVAGSGCAYKSVTTSQSISSGKHTWTIVLRQDADCYASVGIVGSGFNVASDVMGMVPNSWAVAIYPGSHTPSGPCRVHAPTQCMKGDKLVLTLDMNLHTLSVMHVPVNGAQRSVAQFDIAAAVVVPVWPALTVCEKTLGGYSIE